MTNDDSNKSENDNVQPIPEEQQNISVEEIVEADYEVVPPSATDEEDSSGPEKRAPPPITPPGRTRNSDSIDASSSDPEGSRHRDAFTTGYDSSMATRIGDERDGDGDAERLRELHEGRHRSDGDHSTRESQRDKKRIAEAICSSLPLATHEREKVVNAVTQLDLSRFGSQKGLARVTLGVVVVVVDEQHRTGTENGDIVMWTEEFRSICKKHEISMSDLATVKKKVRTALEEQNIVLETGVPRRDPLLPGPTPTEDYPDEYWENQSPEYWVWLARSCERVQDDLKDGLPEEYRELIDQLRHWEPWTLDEDEQGTSENGASTDEQCSEASEVELEELSDEVEKELDEIEDAVSEELQ